jgi:glycerophosphoryl diester phosphodiesterase
MPDVTVLGHAGISLHRDRAIFPANSFESIEYAIDVLDSDGIEVDVQMTKDSVLVLYHDKYLDYSTNLTGCVSNYSYDEIKNAKLDNTSYTIVTLEKIMKYLASRKKTLFLDLKAFDFCEDKSIDISAFNYGFLNCTAGLTVEFMNNVIVSNESPLILNQVNHSNKCLEVYNVKTGIEKLETYGFQSMLISLNYVVESDKDILESVNWGVLGMKDKWTVDKAVNLFPKFVITDNIAYTNKVTN